MYNTKYHSLATMVWSGKLASYNKYFLQTIFLLMFQLAATLGSLSWFLKNCSFFFMILGYIFC